MEHERQAPGDELTARPRHTPLDGLHFAGEPAAAWAVVAWESVFADVARASLLRDHARWGLEAPINDQQETSPVGNPPDSAA